MRALVACVVLGALGGVARAEQTQTIKAPAGWKLDERQSAAVSAKLNEVGHFGQPAVPRLAIANADVYVAPKPGIVLTVTLIGGTIGDQREASARAAVDELHAASQRAALAGTGIVEEGWQEKVDPAAKQIEATLAWRDTSAKTSSSSRLLIAGDATNLMAATGECFASDDADPKGVADCKAALATLDPGIAPAQRVALALAPTGARPTWTASTPGTAMGSGAVPARMDDGSRAPLPPMTVPQEGRATDRRPVYVGIGLVLLAAVFWWNRHRRARREEES
ncbi:MAG TPA: hypothetical protein VIV11_29660 [Kofleriaceae bacterium]